MDMHDMGNIRDRSWRQTYESSTFTWNRSATRGTIIADAVVPDGCSLKVEVRSSASSSELQSSAWHLVEHGAFELGPSDRVMQYRVVFISDNGDSYPSLRRVGVKL
jgi:hypothetical protein